MFILSLLKNKIETKRYFSQKILFTIGSSSQCDLVLPEKNVAPLHCHLILKKGKYNLVNLDPNKKTWVNDRKIESQSLKEGDLIKLGSAVLKFSMKKEEAEEKISLAEKIEEIKNQISPFDYEFIKEKISLKEKKEKVLNTLFQIGQELNQFKSKDELLGIILEVAQRTLPGEKGYLLIKEGTEFIPWNTGKQEVEISYTVIKKLEETKKPLLISNAFEDENFKHQKSIITYRIKSFFLVPFRNRKDEIIAILYLFSSSPHIFSQEDVFLIEGFANYAAIALENSLFWEKEKENIKEREKKEYQKKLEELKEVRKFQSEEMIFTSEVMVELYKKALRVAKTDLTILLTGETGTGKELLARAIHQHSLRGTQPLVVINCGAIPEHLLESELFGYEKGAFTGAFQAKKGKIELAEGGTVFFDEIGELPLALQVKLLRVLQERKIEPVGGIKTKPVDFRVIAATNKNLAEEVKNKRFREDLYYRLNEISLYLPPLRERGKDILVLANYFLNRFSRQFSREIKGFSLSAQSALLNYHWPGNIRELENKIKRAVLISSGSYLTAKNLELSGDEELSFKEQKQKMDEEIEKEAIRDALEKTGGNLSRAAVLIGVDRKTLRRKIKKYQLKKFFN